MTEDANDIGLEAKADGKNGSGRNQSRVRINSEELCLFVDVIRGV